MIGLDTGAKASTLQPQSRRMGIRARKRKATAVPLQNWKFSIEEDLDSQTELGGYAASARIEPQIVKLPAGAVDLVLGAGWLTRILRGTSR